MVDMMALHGTYCFPLFGDLMALHGLYCESNPWITTESILALEDLIGRHKCMQTNLGGFLFIFLKVFIYLLILFKIVNPIYRAPNA